MGIFSRIAQAVFNSAPAPRAPVYYRAPRDTSRWPQWLSTGLTITRMSAILRQADQGYLTDYFQLIQEVAAREALIGGLLSVRRAALSQRPVVFQPATGRHVDAARATEVAQYAQEIYNGLRLSRTIDGRSELYGGGKTLVEQLTLACYYGVRVLWVNWSAPTGHPRPRPTSIEILDERRLWHDIHTDALYLATAQDPSRGINLSNVAPELCIVARYPLISQQLAMAGAARAILLPWWIRFSSYKDFATYLETWSKPSLLATSSSDVAASYDEETLARVENLLEDWMGDTRSVLPEGFKIEIIEAVKGGELVFESVDTMTERHLQFALVGQIGAIAGDVTTHAAGTQAQRVRDDLTDGDAVFVGEILERIMAPALAVEFGPGFPMPRCTFAAEQTIEAKKAKALAWSAAILPITSAMKAGIAVDPALAFKEFGIPLRPDGKLDPQWLANLQAVSQVSMGTPAAPTEPGGASTPPAGNLPPGDRPPPAPMAASRAEQFDRAHNGIMIALYPSPDVQAALALAGDEPAEEIHLTLAYLGDAGTYPHTDILVSVVQEWAKQQAPLSGKVQGVGVWGKPGEYVLWASPDVQGLAEARVDLMQRLRAAGCDTGHATEHDFTPHLTLAYSDTLPTLPEVPPLPLQFDAVWLVQAGQRTAYRFGAP